MCAVAGVSRFIHYVFWHKIGPVLAVLPLILGQFVSNPDKTATNSHRYYIVIVQDGILILLLCHAFYNFGRY